MSSSAPPLLGYDRTTTDELLDEIVASFEEVWRERADLRDEIEELEAELDAQKELEVTPSQHAPLRGADGRRRPRATRGREADVIVSEARSSARDIVPSAETERERIQRRDPPSRTLEVETFAPTIGLFSWPRSTASRATRRSAGVGPGRLIGRETPGYTQTVAPPAPAMNTDLYRDICRRTRGTRRDQSSARGQLRLARGRDRGGDVRQPSRATRPPRRSTGRSTTRSRRTRSTSCAIDEALSESRKDLRDLRRCGKPIAEERLEAIPYANKCIDCKRLEERG